MSTTLIERDPTGVDAPNERNTHRGIADGLAELTRILDTEDDLGAHWSRSASIIAELLDAQSCWIVFSSTDESGDMTVRAYGDQGGLPTCAVRDLVRRGSLFRQVHATAQCVLAADADLSGYDPMSADHDAARQSIILAPIRLGDVTVGVVKVHGKRHRPQFNERHLDIVRIATLLIGESIHQAKLRKVLNSRFAQLALMQGAAAPTDHVASDPVKRTDGMANLLARSFYREMSRAGFDPHEIIAAASEIISQLANSLKTRDKQARRQRAVAHA